MNKYNFQVGDYYIAEYIPIKPIMKMDLKTLGNDIRLPYCKPIPITEEWLELNELFLDTKCSMNIDGEEFKYWYSRDHRLMITNLSNTIYNGFSADVRMFKAHMDNDHYETIGSLDVQYVHQLLHLCRDCQYKFEPKFK